METTNQAIAKSEEYRLKSDSTLGQKTRYAQQPPPSVLTHLEPVGNNVEILSMPKILRLGAIEGEESKNY